MEVWGGTKQGQSQQVTKTGVLSGRKGEQVSGHSRCRARKNRTQNLEGAAGDVVTSPAETRVRSSNSCVTNGNLTSLPPSLSTWAK